MKKKIGGILKWVWQIFLILYVPFIIGKFGYDIRDIKLQDWTYENHVRYGDTLRAYMNKDSFYFFLGKSEAYWELYKKVK